ncbi:hypothetical protein Hanom_Chr16g01505411 [Helianthus anomalus]
MVVVWRVAMRRRRVAVAATAAVGGEWRKWRWVAAEVAVVGSGGGGIDDGGG